MFAKAFADLKRIKNVDWHWLVVWVVIYFSFLFLDIIAPHFQGTNIIKYVGLFLCVVYSYQKFHFDTLLILALLFTLLADTILVWTPWDIPGVYCFCFAQFFHIARFTKAQPKALAAFFIMAFIIFGVGIFHGFDPIYVIAFIYAIGLITNLVLAIRWFRRDHNNFHARCALYGFALFICCDICVGLQYLAFQSILPSVIIPTVTYLVWLFYYPSQVMISNSSNLQASGEKLP